uniref:Uncharacterized protein n=1 Tax=Arundo donax TaxID=35708 RepID=A0A0A9A1A3_ARUDO
MNYKSVICFNFALNSHLLKQLDPCFTEAWQLQYCLFVVLLESLVQIIL